MRKIVNSRFIAGSVAASVFGNLRRSAYFLGKAEKSARIRSP